MLSVAPAKSTFYSLSGYYFFFFASLGAFLPYWGLYLKTLGFDPQAIGELMAVIMVTKVIGPNIWGWIADHTGAYMRMIRVAALIAVLAFSALLWVVDYWLILGALAFFSFFWNAALPLFEATTMNHLGDDVHHYSKIRLWGSIGFIFSVTALAPVFDRFDMRILPSIVLALLICIWLNTLWVKDRKSQSPEEHHPRLLGTLKQQIVVCLLIACMLTQASHGPYYTFFSIYLEGYGYSRTLIGMLWALGVVAEIVVFLFMHHWLYLFGARNLFLIALLFTVVRWLLIANQAQDLSIMLLAQLMHAASFGLYHAAAIQMIHKLFPGKLQGRGQALYSSLSFGLGGAIGSFLSGYVWNGLGETWIYYMAAIMAGVGFLIAWWGLGEIRELRN